MTSAISRRRASLPLSASRHAPSPSQCDGWLQICLNRIRDASTRPRRFMPSARSELGRQLVDRLLVERRLLARQVAERLHLGLVRQIGDDGLVGLQPPQDVRPHQLAQRRVRVVRLCREPLGERRELLARSEQARVEEVEDRPEIAKPVLDRRAGERDARPRVELLGRPRLLGAGFLIACASSRMARRHGVASSAGTRSSEP